MSTSGLDTFTPDQAPISRRAGFAQAIDFVNTTGLSKGRPFEDFSIPDDAVDWLAAAGFLDAAAAAAERARLAGDSTDGGAVLGRLRAVRSGLRELIDAQAEERPPASAAVEVVNGALGLPEQVQLVAVGARVQVAVRREGEPLDQALAAIARLVANELSDGQPDRLRICENDRCRWVFYDRSRPGTRRWCEMSSCGNRMKAARHRARQRAEIEHA